MIFLAATFRWLQARHFIMRDIVAAAEDYFDYRRFPCMRSSRQFRRRCRTGVFVIIGATGRISCF